MQNIDQAIKILLDCGRLRVDLESGLVYAPKSNTPDKSVGAKNKKGYLRTCINFNGAKITFMVHRAVWIAMYGIPNPGLQIDHGPGGKTDNHLSNLSLVTNVENMRRATINGLTHGGWRDAPRNPINGQFVGKKAAGRLLDGREYSELPKGVK